MTRYLAATFSAALLSAAFAMPASACNGCGCSAPTAAADGTDTAAEIASGHKAQDGHTHDHGDGAHSHSNSHGSDAMASAEVGKAAPDFQLMDQNGEPVALSDFSGAPVVVEFFNDQCPFVKKFYTNGDMNRLAAEASETYGATWLAIDASNFSNIEENAEIAEKWNIDRPILDGSDGKVGKAYSAKTTPHMYVIDGEGTLVYAGAIDSKSSTDPADIEGATNYVMQALAELDSGSSVSQPTTKAYGCSVKY